MTPEELAAAHARAFRRPRPWSAVEFAALLTSPHVFLLGDARAFALGRVVLDEAELLTIATDPDHRRRGLGATMLAAFHATATTRGAQRAFLEVAADNPAACALYRGAGYAEDGRRAGYYRSATGARIDALLFSRVLS